MIDLIRENKFITAPEIAKATGRSEATIYRHMGEMARSGILRRVGSRKSGYWQLKN